MNANLHPHTGAWSMPAWIIAGALIALLSQRGLAEDFQYEEDAGRPVAEELAEARAQKEEGLAKARQSVEARGDEAGLASEALDILARASALYSDIDERGSAPEKSEAEAALTEIAGAMYWTRKLVAELVQAPPKGFTEDDAREGWKEAVTFEIENPGRGAEILMVYKAVVETFPGTRYAEQARQRLLVMVELEEPETEVASKPEAGGAEAGGNEAPDAPDALAADASMPVPPRLDAATVAKRKTSASSRDVAQALVERLGSTEADVRMSAAKELSQINHSSAVAAMVKVFAEDPDDALRESMAEALKSTPERATVRALENLARRKADDELQLRAIALLRDIGTLRAGEAIAEFASKDEKDLQVFDAALNALGIMGKNAGKGLFGLVKEVKTYAQADQLAGVVRAAGDGKMAGVLMPFLDKKYLKKRYGPMMEDKMASPGVKAMIALGKGACPALIRGLSLDDYRQYSHYCLKEISGQSYDWQDIASWTSWYEANRR